MVAAATRTGAAHDAAPLGILAGGSGVPCEIAAIVTGRGRGVHIVGLDGEAEPEIARFPHTWVNIGGIGAMIRAFQLHGCREIVIVGRVRRPNLLAIRPDFGFWRSLPVLLPFLRGGDDAILRMVVGFFERHGLGVVGVHEAAPELIAPVGVLGRHAPAAPQHRAIGHCTAALAALGPFDAAQAAVATAAGLAAVEGADGTDAMLRRLADPAARVRRGEAQSAVGKGGKGVLVKMPKPGQEHRIDLPAIGPDTMRRAAEAGLAGVAVLSGQTLFAERQAAIEIADDAGLFVLGLERGAVEIGAEVAGDRAGDGAGDGAVDLGSLKPLAARQPGAAHLEDADLGCKVLGALDGFWPCASVVVSRNYVLATEGPGGAMAAAERAGRLKPWGMRLLRRRSGVLVMTDIVGEVGYDPGELVRRARASGLAGLVILRSTRDEAALAALRAEADRTRLFLLAPGDAR